MLLRLNLKLIRFAFLAWVILASASVYAAETSPAGLWKTIDDRSGQAKGLIRIREIAGKFEGKIDKIFPQPGDDPAFRPVWGTKTSYDGPPPSCPGGGGPQLNHL